jgi:SNF2 family DNA or RNA helicase
MRLEYEAMLTPREYQLEAIKVMQRKNLLLADQCGLGKTLQAIEAAKLVQSTLRKPVLIVAPKAVKGQWVKALLAQGLGDRLVNVKPFDSIERDLDWRIVHYEELVKNIATPAYARYFAAVICDEAHRIKNRKTLRTQAVKQLKSFRRIALTGTPYDRNPADIWSILNWLDPSFFSSYWRFFNAHISYSERVIRGQTIKQINTQPLVSPEQFTRVLRPFMMQRFKADVRSDLPPRIDQYIELSMSDQQASYYKKLAIADDVNVKLDDVTEIDLPIYLTKILNLVKATTDTELLGVTKPASVKLDWVTEWVNDNPNESVIIFTRFRDTAIKLAKLLNADPDRADRQFKLIIGGVKKPEITEQDRYIVGTIAAMGEGLDLPHIDHAIFIDVEWSSILMQQAIDRIHRINITQAKHVYYLLCDNTVDQLLHTAIELKWSTKRLVETFLAGNSSQRDWSTLREGGN